MSKKNLITYYDFEMETGEVLKLTLNYLALYKLQAKDRKSWEEYNRIMTKGPQDEFDNLRLLYTGYLCGLLMDKGEMEDAMDFEEFISETSPDREYIGQTLKSLVNPKKAMASAAPSN